MIKQSEIKVLLMAKVHGGNLHHIYADTEILSARRRSEEINFYLFILFLF
jgi:hypothetical protein